VTSQGVQHLTLSWSEAHELELEPVAISGAVTAHRLGRSIPVGEGIVVPVVAIDLGLVARAVSRRHVRLDNTTWQIEGDGDPWTLTLDDRGLPVWPVSAGESSGVGEWPLELEPRG